MTTGRRPTRATVEGRAYLDLQQLARSQHRPTDELHQLYALEGFLARLVASPHAERLVLKGGVLLAAYDARRPTRDVDLQARTIAGHPDDVLHLVTSVAARSLDDGLTFDINSATADTIRDEDEYAGVRVTLAATLASARLRMHVDINIGDPIWPAPRQIDLPRLLGGSITVTGYPLPMVYAEKIVTALQRGTSNTRWRDFADLYLLTASHPVDRRDVQRAVEEVARYRHVTLSSLTIALDGYAELAQARWAAWRRKQRLDDRLPGSFAALLEAVISFTDPVLAGGPADQRWDPATRRWL